MRVSLDTLLERRALLWVMLAGLLILGSGYGMHEPWAPDSPRFAGIARDMLATGNWLFPRVGGDLYADKPPFFFWLLSAAFWLTGSVRAGFLLPSLLAALGTLWLTFDLARRLWDTRTALFASLLLLATVQFSLQAHSAQIDGVLCFWTTLGLYGLLRHLLIGPDWRWYAIGGAACGAGIITKGVGFLPLLVLIPYAALRVRGRLPALTGHPLRWLFAPLAALFVVSLWLVPMVLASHGNPELLAYRNEILFGQTVERYLDAAGHLKPAWYFLTNVIPWAWLPLVLMLPWLIPRWRTAIRAGDARIALPLAWAGLVLLFFSLSSGKRGVYILPALPALCLAAAPWVNELLAKRGLNRFGSLLLLLMTAGAGIGVYWLGASQLDRLDIEDLGIVVHLRWAMALLLVISAGFYLAAFRLGGFVALSSCLAMAWLVTGWYVMPVIDTERSGARIVLAAESMLPPDGELGIARPKESLLLQAHGAMTNFGHRRPNGQQELADAALWVSSSAQRRLIVPQDLLRPCFHVAGAARLGRAHRRTWMLVTAQDATPDCIAKGNASAAIAYTAPRHLPSLFAPPIRGQ